VRRLTLEEWFTRHQLRAIARRHFHLPITLSADVTAAAAYYRARGERPPWTAWVVRAVGQLAAEHPHINRLLFDTPWGPRIVEPSYVAVNVPVILTHDGVPHLSATIVRDPAARTVDAVAAELRAARAKSLAEQPIGRMFIANRNTLLNRLRLRLIHWVVWHSPGLFLKHGGGGISVSSLMLHSEPELRIWAPSYGPTCLTVCITGVHESAGVSTMQLGVGFDHLALSGERAAAAVVALSRLLAAAPVDGAVVPGE
jgi:hypothetical protein